MPMFILMAVLQLADLLSPVCSKPDSTIIGRSSDNTPVELKDEFQNTHQILTGGSGSGKSITLVTQLLSYILRPNDGTNHFVSLIDLVGGSYDQIVSTLGAVNKWFEMQMRNSVLSYRLKMTALRDAFFSRIHLLDFSQPEVQYRLNPLEVREEYGHTPELLASDLIQACERAFSTGKGEMGTVMRQLAINLRTVFSVSAALGTFDGAEPATVFDSTMLFEQSPDKIRKLLKRLNREKGKLARLQFIQHYLDTFVCEVMGSKSAKERRELIHSMTNMLGAFLAVPQVFDFLSARHSTLDIDGLVRDGGVLLVKIPSTDISSQAFLGSLLLTKIQGASARRDKADFKIKKVTIACDEFQTIFNGPFWMQEISQVRNYGVRLLLANQAFGQLTPNGDTSFLETILANTGLQVFYRMVPDDALKVAWQLQPKGTMLRMEYDEVSESKTKTISVTKMRAIARSITRTIARGRTYTTTLSNGTTVTVSRANGVTVVRAKGQGWSVAKGKNWSRFSSNGVTLTRSKSTTTVESRGSADGSASSESNSTSDTTANGNSVSSGTGAHTVADTLTVGDLGLGTAMSGGKQSASESHGKSFSDSSSHSVGQALTKAVSKIANEAVAKGRGTSSGSAVSRSQGQGYGESETNTESMSLSEALSLAQSVSQGLARSISIGQSEGVSETVSEGTSESETESRSVSIGESNGETVSHHKTFYGVDDEARILSYQISGLKKREAFLFNRITGEHVKFRTIDMPIEFDNYFMGTDFTADFLKRVQPEIPDSPEKDLFEILEETEFSSNKNLKAPEGF